MRCPRRASSAAVAIRRGCAAPARMHVPAAAAAPAVAASAVRVILEVDARRASAWCRMHARFVPGGRRATAGFRRIDLGPAVVKT